MTWYDLLQIKIDEWGIILKIGPLIITICVIAAIIFLVALVKQRGLKFWAKWEAVTVDIPIANLGRVTIHPNHETIKVAYRAWVELTTRKAAIPFDEENDVIAEIYDSWYELFKKLRDLAKEIPAQQLRNNKDTRELVRVMVIVLNEGLRLHLTKWHAKFRKWYNSALKNDENSELSPHEIQKDYPEYVALVNDLKQVNQAIIEYAQWLRQIAEGK